MTRHGVTPALLLASAVLGCGAGTEPPAASPWPAGTALPAIRSVGALPPPEARVVVWPAPDGDGLVADGTATDYDGLVSLLARRREAYGTRAQVSPVALVVAFPPEAPWQEVAWTLQATADPRARTCRVFFAVRHAETGEAGGFAAFQPAERGLGSGPPASSSRVVLASTSGDPTSPEHLDTALVEYARRAPGSVLLVSPRPQTPLQAVLLAVDAAHLAGFEFVDFSGAPPRSREAGPDRHDEMRGGIAAWTLGGREIAAAGTPLRAPRIASHIVGFVRTDHPTTGGHRTPKRR